jgi:hypothetical protein
MTFWENIEILFAGALFTIPCNAILTILIFRWKKREETPQHILNRLDALEKAFISHTGMTINGKSYRTEE